MTWPALWMLLAAPAAVGDALPPVVHYQAETVTPGPGVDPAQSTQMAMTKDAYDRMTVPVLLGASGPYRFLIDTGSERTSVSRELAGKLGLAERPGALLPSASGSSQVP